MKTLEQMEAEAEKSFEILEAAIDSAKTMIECLESLAPETYLKIVDSK